MAVIALALVRQSAPVLVKQMALPEAQALRSQRRELLVRVWQSDQRVPVSSAPTPRQLIPWRD